MERPLVINGAVFSNDTTALIEEYRRKKLPQFPKANTNSNDTYYAPLIVNNI
jgi:hypothetical protein